MNEILYQQEQYANPLERAVYLHCNIAKLQPFIDGNKRTSRMVESIALMNTDIIPVYSSRDADILNYRKGSCGRYRTVPVMISGSTHMPPQPYLIEK